MCLPDRVFCLYNMMMMDSCRQSANLPSKQKLQGTDEQGRVNESHHKAVLVSVVGQGLEAEEVHLAGEGWVTGEGVKERGQVEDLAAERVVGSLREGGEEEVMDVLRLQQSKLQRTVDIAALMTCGYFMRQQCTVLPCQVTSSPMSS